MRQSLCIAVLLASIAGDAAAESVFNSAPGSPATLQARLDFKVTIPPVLYLRVGTGNAPYTSNSTRNTLRFNVPFATMGTGTAVAARPTDGDLTNGQLTVRWFNNIGASTQVSLGVAGTMHNGAGSTIAWSEIAVAASSLAVPTAGFTNGGAPHPAAVTPGVIATTSGGVEGVWTYTYRNTGVLPSGTYGGAARNGRITYTAAAV